MMKHRPQGPIANPSTGIVQRFLSFAVAIFGAGVYFSQTEAYEKVRAMFMVPAKDKGEMPNQSFQRTAFGGR